MATDHKPAESTPAALLEQLRDRKQPGPEFEAWKLRDEWKSVDVADPRMLLMNKIKSPPQSPKLNVVRARVPRRPALLVCPADASSVPAQSPHAELLKGPRIHAPEYVDPTGESPIFLSQAYAMGDEQPSEDVTLGKSYLE